MLFIVGCSVISVSYIIYMLTLLIMHLAGLHFCVGLDFVTPFLYFFLSKHHHHLIYIHIYLYIYINIYIYIYMYMYIYIYTYILKSGCMCVFGPATGQHFLHSWKIFWTIKGNWYIYIYIYICICMYTYIHICL
jgi:hypothetical protein